MSNKPDYDRLKRAIFSELEKRVPDWRARVKLYGQVATIDQREAGTPFTDRKIFEGLLLSVLSNNTDWSKVESMRKDLPAIFDDFDPGTFSSRAPESIDLEIKPEFKKRKAGSFTLARNLKLLIHSTRLLLERSRAHGSIDSYIGHLFEQSACDPHELAIKFGTDSPEKLPGLGVALAAEFLRNIGFNLCKPDRHINRASGQWGLVKFAKWPDQSKTKSPAASVGELRKVMVEFSIFANSVGERVSLLDNAVWILCAKSGGRLTNEELRAFALPRNSQSIVCDL